MIDSWDDRKLNGICDDFLPEWTENMSVKSTGMKKWYELLYYNYDNNLPRA